MAFFYFFKKSITSIITQPIMLCVSNLRDDRLMIDGVKNRLMYHYRRGHVSLSNEPCNAIGWSEYRYREFFITSSDLITAEW